VTDPRRLDGLIELLGQRHELRAVLPADGRSAEAVVVNGVTGDARTVAPGDLYAAIVGERLDGHAFVSSAVAAGAAAVLAEQATPGLDAPQLLVQSSRRALALAAAWACGFPSRRLGMVGITGTDGKTTVGYLVRAILEAAGHPTGMAGTIDIVVGGRSLGNEARSTTPQAPRLQALLADMEAAGDRWAVLEASSHGLAQERAGEVAWDVAVLTNVTQEHLEFHGTIAAYVAAKLRLFESLALGPGNPEKGHGKHGIVNIDDPRASTFIAAAQAAGARVVAYGADPAADVRLRSVDEGEHGLRVDVVTPRWEGRLALLLAGRFNAHNALAAVAVGEALGLDPAAIRMGVEAVAGVPGRMERIEMGQPFVAIVDYAHTAEALAKVLDELAPRAERSAGGLIAVLGSAGERDVVKRPAIGLVAGARCRLVVVTDEDPRGEDRMAILEQIAAGVQATAGLPGRELLIVPERREAIRTALGRARPGDVVLFAGKGHEKTIEMADGARPWDEAGEVGAALALLGWTGQGRAERGPA
jgi:UDP-N-acetylmuramoyl-L-alanyl-D-glutamate--2,6-diaminopimelate ligase